MRRRALIICAVAVSAALCLTGCASDSVTRTEFSLDTVNTFTFYGTKNEALLDAPIKRLRALNDKVDAYDEASEVSRINANAGVKPVKVSAFTYGVIKESLRFSKASDGLFDITSGALIDLWAIDDEDTTEAPSQSDIDAAKATIDYRKIVLDDAARTVYLAEKGMRINLGAIAKGAIGDDIRALCKKERVAHGLLNLGGSVVLIGGKTDRANFDIGVNDPANPDQASVGTLSLRNTSVETSGDYERTFTDSAGNTYHHILDPTTGYPADTDLHQVTVIAKNATDCDALSTMFFLLGSDKSMAYLKKHPHIRAIFVTKNGEVMVSRALKSRFTFNRQLRKYHLTYF